MQYLSSCQQRPYESLWLTCILWNSRKKNRNKHQSNGKRLGWLQCILSRASFIKQYVEETTWIPIRSPGPVKQAFPNKNYSDTIIKWSSATIKWWSHDHLIILYDHVWSSYDHHVIIKSSYWSWKYRHFHHQFPSGQIIRFNNIIIIIIIITPNDL